MNPNLRKLAKETKNPDIDMNVKAKGMLRYEDLRFPWTYARFATKLGGVKLDNLDAVIAAILAGNTVLVHSDFENSRLQLGRSIVAKYFCDNEHSCLLPKDYEEMLKVPRDRMMYLQLDLDKLDKQAEVTFANILHSALIKGRQDLKFGENGYFSMLSINRHDFDTSWVKHFDTVLNLDRGGDIDMIAADLEIQDITPAILDANYEIKETAKRNYEQSVIDGNLRYASALKYLAELKQPGTRIEPEDALRAAIEITMVNK
jgi:hypothetical protein